MKRLLIFASLVTSATILPACSSGPQKTSQEKVEEQLSQIYSLTADERALAAANARNYYEQDWPTNSGEKKKGTFINCRPSDSNKNGLVSCTGYVINVSGSLSEKKVYAGYRKDLVGVSDIDSLAPGK